MATIAYKTALAVTKSVAKQHASPSHSRSSSPAAAAAANPTLTRKLTDQLRESSPSRQQLTEGGKKLIGRGVKLGVRKLAERKERKMVKKRGQDLDGFFAGGSGAQQGGQEEEVYYEEEEEVYVQEQGLGEGEVGYEEEGEYEDEDDEREERGRGRGQQVRAEADGYVEDEEGSDVEGSIEGANGYENDGGEDGEDEDGEEDDEEVEITIRVPKKWVLEKVMEKIAA